MPLDIDYVAAQTAINHIQQKLSNTPHGQREKIADKIIKFNNSLEG